MDYVRQRRNKLSLVKDKEEIPEMTYEHPSEIFLWDKNPRRNEQAIKKLALVLAIYGQKSPVVCWRKNNVVYKGNTTLKAIRFLYNMTLVEFSEFTKVVREKGVRCTKLNQVLVLWQDFKDEEEAKDYGKVDNKSNEWTEWDEDLLDEAFANRKDIELLSFVTGFTQDEIKNLSLIPDIDKINNIQEGKSSLSGIVKLVCPAEERDDLIDWLKEELPDAKFTNVEIR